MATTLTPHDTAILSSLFTNEPPQILHPPRHSPPTNSPTLLAIKRREASAVALLSETQPSPATLEDAIHQLDVLIRDHGDYASAYNNRAQAARLLIGDDLTVQGTAGIWEDLGTCIALAKAQPLAERDERLLGAAYTQRGVLLLTTARAIRNGKETRDLPGELSGMGGGEMEREAENSFKAGAGFGDEAARVMVVHLNPMRKLCGQMVREALRSDMEKSGVFSGGERGEEEE